MEEKLAENYEKLEQDVEKIPEDSGCPVVQGIDTASGRAGEAAGAFILLPLFGGNDGRPLFPSGCPGTLLSGDRGVFGRHVSLQPSVTG